MLRLVCLRYSRLSEPVLTVLLQQRFIPSGFRRAVFHGLLVLKGFSQLSLPSRADFQIQRYIKKNPNKTKPKNNHPSPPKSQQSKPQKAPQTSTVLQFLLLFLCSREWQRQNIVLFSLHSVCLSSVLTPIILMIFDRGQSGGLSAG